MAGEFSWQNNMSITYLIIELKPGTIICPVNPTRTMIAGPHRVMFMLKTPIIATITIQDHFLGISRKSNMSTKNSMQRLSTISDMDAISVSRVFHDIRTIRGLSKMINMTTLGTMRTMSTMGLMRRLDRTSQLQKTTSREQAATFAYTQG
jgi:hypothetical protein